MAPCLRLADFMTGLVLVSVSLTADGQAVYVRSGKVHHAEQLDQPGQVDTTLLLDRPVGHCGSIVVTSVHSPNDEYRLEQGLSCPNETIKCWAGVRSGKSTKRNTPEGMIWSIPYVNLTVVESCTLRFTMDGDLQFVVSGLDVENGMPAVHNGIVVWNTNTAGKGAVEVQVQENGNLVLVHEDGKSVVWQSHVAPLLPLPPLHVSASHSWRISLTMVIMLVCSSTLLVILDLHELTL